MRRGYFTPPVLIILAIIIFAVAILIAINTDLVKRIKKEPAPTPSSSPITQQSPSAPAAGRGPYDSAETANWKTYTKDKFSIKLPSSFVETIYEHFYSPESGGKHYFFSSPDYSSNKYDGECRIRNKNSITISIDVKAFAPSLNTLDKIREFAMPKYSTYKEEEITLDGQPGIRFLVEFNQCGYKNVLGIGDQIYTINKLGIRFTIQADYFKGDEENKHIFDQILSTFQFID